MSLGQTFQCCYPSSEGIMKQVPVGHSFQDCYIHTTFCLLTEDIAIQCEDTVRAHDMPDPNGYSLSQPMCMPPVPPVLPVTSVPPVDTWILFHPSLFLLPPGSETSGSGSVASFASGVSGLGASSGC